MHHQVRLVILGMVIIILGSSAQAWGIQHLELQRESPARAHAHDDLDAAFVPIDLRPDFENNVFRDSEERKDKLKFLAAESKKYAETTASFTDPQRRNQVLTFSFLSAFELGAREIDSSPVILKPSVRDRAVAGSVLSDATYINNSARLIQNQEQAWLFQDRIVGGEPVGLESNDFKAVVATGYTHRNVTRYTGTGTLIRRNVVLTAAHLYSSTRRGINGQVLFDDFAPGRGRVVKVRKAIPHPNFKRNPGPGERHNDIMVLILDEDVNDVTPIDLAPLGTLGSRPSHIRAVGFGRFVATGPSDYGVKRMANIPIAAYGLPDEQIGYDYGFDRGSEFVAGRIDPQAPEVDTCKGDSGGGNFVQINDTGPWFLLGITSRPSRVVTFRPTERTRRLCGDGGIYPRGDADARDNHAFIIEASTHPENFPDDPA